MHINQLTDEGLFYGETFVETIYERLKIPFNLRAVEGNVNSQEITFSNSFPGKISSQAVKLSSTFTHEIALKSVEVFPEDKRFNFEYEKRFIDFGENIVGHLYFDPSKTCGKVCYSGIDTTKEVGHLWLLGLALHHDTGYIDKELHKLFYTRWINMQKTDKM